ncbi:copper transporter [Ancrocorticia populi]|uniref:copper transporter n=1 Tax=Ancrocorticia populi TaxID=2175228 RepID=UPI0023564690|nr:copper transporter [Ancrocorticia populi]
MVDFRYHLVSLVSVFLALAVGIILGAGPLQNSIGNTLTGQIDTLRESRDSLRDELAVTEDQLSGSDSALDVAANELLPGTLTGRNVAIVVLPEASSDAVSDLIESLELAGASVSGQVTLNESYANSEKATYRGAFSNQVSEYIDSLPDNPTNDQVVASALDYVLRKGTGDENAKVLLGSLTAEGDALLSVDREVKDPADAVIVVTPESLNTEDADLTANEKSEIESQTGIYTEMFSEVAGRGPTVGYGRALNDDDLLTTLRGTNEGSTVDSIATTPGRINVPLAVASEISGDHVSLGSQQGADAPLGERVDASAKDNGSDN